MTDRNTFALVASMLTIAMDSAYQGKISPTDANRLECIKYMRRAAMELGCTLVEPMTEDELSSALEQTEQPDHQPLVVGSDDRTTDLSMGR